MARGDFGELLQRRRKQAGLRQLDLAGLVGMGRSTIANIEAGRERPTPRLWLALADAFPDWSDELRDAYHRDRVRTSSMPTDHQTSAPTPPLGGPFVVESVSYVYLFEESRSPSEIMEVRRVRATEIGASRFHLSLRHTRSPGFVVDEQPLWGGHLAYTEHVNDAGETAYLRTFEFGKRLKRGERHEFATRTWIERDPDPQTEVCFDLTIPATEVSIHLGFHGTPQPAVAWSYGPVPDDAHIPATPEGGRRVEINAGTASAYFSTPELGPVYGIAWTWAQDLAA